MSLAGFVERLREQKNAAYARREKATIPQEKAAATREINYLNKQIDKATRGRIDRDI